jgi:hypothetical protein
MHLLKATAIAKTPLPLQYTYTITFQTDPSLMVLPVPGLST